MWDAALEVIEGDVKSGQMPHHAAAEWSAWIYCASGQFDKAAAITDSEATNVRLDPERAIVAAESGQLQRARQTAQDAIPKRRDKAEFAMAHVMEACGDTESAILWYERVAAELRAGPSH